MNLRKNVMEYYMKYSTSILSNILHIHGIIPNHEIFFFLQKFREIAISRNLKNDIKFTKFFQNNKNNCKFIFTIIC